MKSRKLQACQQRKHPEAPRTCLGCHRGFTLVELIVVIGIFSIVMAAIYSVFVRSNRVYISQEEVVAAQQEARSALEILGREIRMAGLIAADNQSGGFDMITTAAWAANPDSDIEIATVDVANRTTTLAFKSDLDDDGNTDAVRYVYYHSDHITASRQNTLYRETLTWSGGTWADPSGVGEQLFLENIQSLTLTYQMADGTTNTAPANLEDIRGVVINLVAQTAHAVEPYEGGKFVRTRQLISNIQIRNLGLS
ncbi:MAG: prepilin-type N-terminal cleavage/methylation domain-containing protein [Syntrophobacteria bacterium]